MTSRSTTETDRLLEPGGIGSGGMNSVSQRNDDDDPWPEPSEMGHSGTGVVPSAGTYLKDSLLLRRAGTLAQVGLLVSAVTIWKVLWSNPAGLFTWHPALQSVAVVAFAEGVLLLQPAPRNQSYKAKGLQLHQVFQYTGLPIILAGTAVIIYNKAIHGAKHIQSWHAVFGVITLALILLQITFGAVIVYAPLTSLFGGEAQAKKWWKYHRMTGYLTLSGLFITPLLALDSDWILQHSSPVERWLAGGGFALAAVGVLARISTTKLGLRQR